MRYPTRRERDAVAHAAARQREVPDLKRRLAGERLLRWAQTVASSGWSVSRDDHVWIWLLALDGQRVVRLEVAVLSGAKMAEADTAVVEAISDSPRCPPELRDAWRAATWQEMNRG